MRQKLSTNLDLLLPAGKAAIFAPCILWTTALRLEIDPVWVSVCEMGEGALGLLVVVVGGVVLAEEMGGCLAGWVYDLAEGA